MKTLKNINWKATAGYTIDQTILVVAVIALLITLVIASVGWDILNRAGGTKLASQLKQIENANGQFFGEHQAWPHTINTAVDTNAERIEILTGSSAGVTLTTNYLPGFEVNSNVLQHNFGNGGAIGQRLEAGTTSICPGTSDFLVITMAAVPIDSIEEADDSVDSGDGNAAGKVQWNTSGDLTYCANVIN